MGRSFTRQELYALVWAQARTALAKQLAVSDVWIGKQCKSAQIPMPPAGHWARTQHGKATRRPPLPIRLPGHASVVVVGESPSTGRWRRHEDLAEPILPPVFDEDIDAQVDAALSVIGKVTPTRDLARPHSGLSRILDREAKRRAKSVSSRWTHDQPLFDDATHQRQLRLFNSLAYAFERASAKADVYDDQQWIQGLGTVHQLRLRIDFGACALDLFVLEPTASAKTTGAKPPSTTTLRVGHRRSDHPSEQWCDRDGSRLEQQLATIRGRSCTARNELCDTKPNATMNGDWSAARSTSRNSKHRD